MYIHNLERKYNSVNDTVTLSGPCFVTKKLYSVTVKATQLQNYLNGAFAQNAFPNLSAEDREFLISGTSPEGWKILFGGSDD